MPSVNIINIGDWSKPAQEFIRQLGSAAGIVFEPHRVRRKAAAEADARLIEAKASADVKAIEERARLRLSEEIIREQQHIESIVAKSLPLLSPNTTPEDLNPDWIRFTIDKAKKYSNPYMQELWARILAGEWNHPGTFSRRTISIVECMDQADAEHFTTLCKGVWKLGRDWWILPSTHIIGGSETSFIQNINDYACLRLETQGLIYMDQFILGHNISRDTSLEFLPSGYKLQVISSTSNKTWILGCATLSAFGKELATLCDTQEYDKYFWDCISMWRQAGLYLGIPLSSS